MPLRLTGLRLAGFKSFADPTELPVAPGLTGVVGPNGCGKSNLLEALLDARFVRMWRFYLAASEASFRHGRQDVFQIQLARAVDAVPITRDYLYRDDAEALRHAAE